MPKFLSIAIAAMLALIPPVLPLAAHAEERPAKQESFASPTAAARAFKAAVAKHDIDALFDIFGHEHRELILGDDPATTRVERRRVAALVRQRLNLVRVTDDKFVLLLGRQDWTLPIPIVRDRKRWRFDTDAGELEVLARRIGRNELAAIATLDTFVRAETEYAARRQARGEPKQYATYVMSTPGRPDGLWWDADTAKKAGPSPLAQFVRAQQEFLEGRQPGDPYQGYFFRILTGQGPDAPGGTKSYLEPNGHMTKGFAMIAWPAKYGATGIMTFIVGPEAKVYRKDLGQQTQTLVDTIFVFNPDQSWTAETQ